MTAFAEPREVLAVASYPLRAGAEAGECAPDTARADMPAGGAFIWLLEYREVLPAARFPERPPAFHLEGGELDEHVSCFPGPGYSTTFRAPGRQFQLLVAFGGPPTDRRLREVEAVLNGLVIEPQPTASPPPLGRWRLAVTATGDSLRTPPGWPSAAGNPYGREGPYGPPLFFAANRPLVGLPSEPGSEADLPGPLPDNALANGFPPDGVLLWVLEDSGRQPLARDFAPIERDWPRRDDFEPVEIFTKPAPELRWLVAAGNLGGRRLSVWIARGPQASGADLSLALKSASTLALSARR